MNRQLALSSLVLALSLASTGCSSSDDDGGNESFDGLYAPAQAAVNTSSVFGTWGGSSEQSGFDLERRIKLTASSITLSLRCTKGAESAIVGVTVAATVTETNATVTEGKSDSKVVAGAQCAVQITAGQAALAASDGKLNFGNVFTFDQKLSD